MAKVINPLFSIEASGKFADTVVYQKWKGIDFARKFVKPTNANTSAQLQIRGYFKTAIAAWQAEQSSVKLAWNTYAKTNNLAMTGMNKDKLAVLIDVWDCMYKTYRIWDAFPA